MSNTIVFDDWEQRDSDMNRDDCLVDFCDQLRTWAQKNAEAKRLRAEVDSEIVCFELMQHQTALT